MFTDTLPKIYRLLVSKLTQKYNMQVALSMKEGLCLEMSWLLLEHNQTLFCP